MLPQRCPSLGGGTDPITASIQKVGSLFLATYGNYPNFDLRRSSSKEIHCTIFKTTSLFLRT